MKFILSRNKDYLTHSKKWMVGYAMLFWVITRIIAMVMMGVCMYLYDRYGLNPKELTDFGGDPTVTKNAGNLWRGIIMLALAAPVFEEFLFRFGLSFRRISIAVSCACIALFPAFSHNRTTSVTMWVIYGLAAVLIFCVIYFTTTDKFWQEKKNRWQVPMIWISTIAFGLVHLCAFSTLTWTLLPYALVMSCVPFFGGCAMAYLRVNMGFGWGIAMHIFNNIPGIIVMLM